MSPASRNPLAPVPRGAGDLDVRDWATVISVMYPLTLQAGKLTGKSLQAKGQLIANEVIPFVKDPARYGLHRTPLLEILARVYAYYIWAAVGEGGGLTADVYEGAHALCAEKMSEAIQILATSMPKGQGAVTTLFINFRKSRSPAPALLTLFRDLDSYFIFSSIRSTERQRFKQMTPSATDTPAGWADVLEGDGSVRGLVDIDVLDVLRANLETKAPRLFEIMGGNVDWDDVASVRDFLRKNPMGQRTFAELAPGNPVVAPPPRRAAPVAVPSFATGLGGLEAGEQIVDVINFNTRTRTTHDVDGFINDVPMSKLSDVVSQMTAALENLQKNAQQAPSSPSRQEPSTDMHRLLAQLQNATARINRGENVSLDEVRGLHQTFATIRPPRVVLDWPKIYPVLYPGAPIPPERALVGGTGHANPCAACAKHRPAKVNWLSYEEASQNPAYIGTDGRLDARTLPKDTAILHNPGRCGFLHKDVDARVASNPADQWMLKERALPRP